MDMLSELAPNQTPYRYGFNNPVFWQDKTGLFESRGAAQEWIDTWGLTGANIYYNPHKGVYQIENNGVSFYQLGEDIISHMYSMDTGELLYTITRGAAASGGGSDGSSGMNWAQVNQGVGAFGVANGVKTGLIDFAGKNGGLTKATANYLKVFKGAGAVGGVATIAITGYDIYEKGYATGRDIADIGFATAGVVGIFIVSNPVGWIIGGASLTWAAGTLIYDYYND